MMNTATKLRMIPALAVLVAGSSLAGPIVSYEELFRSHSASIVQIRLCGEIAAQRERGVYRIVHAFLYGQSWLYVNRLVMNRKNTEYRVDRTLSIREFNHSHADVSLQKLKCRTVAKELVVTGLSWSAHTDRTRRLKLRIKPDLSSYRLSYY